MYSGILRFFPFSSAVLSILLAAGVNATQTQTIPIDVVDFQQYKAYQNYLAKNAPYKVFVVSENMQPGAMYGWGIVAKEAEKAALDACKEKFRWSCKVVSVNGEILGETRTIPAEINVPNANTNPDLASQSDEVKALFSEYPYTNMYSSAPEHKAFATNKFGRNGSGHGRGYITEEIAIEKAKLHCQLSVDLTKQAHKKTPCHVVAVNDRLIPENINKVLAQKELGPAAIETGSYSESWHGAYAVVFPELPPEFALTEKDRLVYVFGAGGFQLKKGTEVMSSGTYSKSGNKVELQLKTGQDPGMHKVVFSDDGQTLMFEDEGYEKLTFIKQ